MLVLYAVWQPQAKVLSALAAHTPVNAGKQQLNWLTLEEAEAAIKVKKKAILIDLYTDWCGWCKVMDKKTYSNPEVIKYVEDNFYPVKIDAETSKTLTWKNKVYNYDPKYRINTFALYLTNGQLSFPTTVILPADNSDPQIIPGYLKVPDMELVLRYFGDDHFGKTSFDSYRNSFTASWK